MNICALALFSLVSVHSVPISGAGCAASAYTRGWDQLLHRTSIAKDDTRFGLHEGAPKYGISKAEAEWLKQVTGRVICPGALNLKGTLGSGSLVGRNDLILANVHGLRNADGSKRDDWPKCYFESQSQPPIRRTLKLSDPDTIFGTRHANTEPDLDYALIRLEEPILGIDPIPIAMDAADLKKNQEMFVVSGHQERMKKGRKVLSNEPVIQRCKARDINPSAYDSGMVVVSDCSTTGGSSGSIILTRDQNNRLVGIGVHARGTKPSADGKDYDSVDETAHRSIELMFEGPLKKALQRSLGLEPSTKEN